MKWRVKQRSLQRTKVSSTTDAVTSYWVTSGLGQLTLCRESSKNIGITYEREIEEVFLVKVTSMLNLASS